MKRTIIGIIAGSIIGGLLFFPPSIPITFTLSLELDADGIGKYDTTISLLFYFLPLVGSIIGSVVGGYIGKNKISLAPYKNKSCSISIWCLLLFSGLGFEIGFLFSPVTLIGLGNTSTAADLWAFSLIFGIVGTFLGILVGFLAFFVSYETA